MHRIILVVPNFPKLSETFILNKFVELLKLNWDVHVVCWKSEDDEWRKFSGQEKRSDIKRRVHVVWPHHTRLIALILFPLAILRCMIFAPSTTMKYLSRGWKDFGFDIFRKLYLDAELIVLNPDLVHFEFGALAKDRMYLKKFLDCKIIVSFRGYDLNFSGLDDPSYYKDVWDSADGIHLLGQDLWQRAQRRGCPATKFHALISPAIDTQIFKPHIKEVPQNLGTIARPLRILSVGRLTWKKGYEFALEAIQSLLKCGISCEYRVVGDGDYYEGLTFTRHQMGLSNNVEFLGWQTPTEVCRQMEWADVFLHSAVSEGFCNAVIEAQSMGLPIVTSDADGLSENVADGVTGFVVSRRDSKGLAKKLKLLADNPSLITTLGQAGRKRVIQKFQISDQIEQFESFYQRTFEVRG